MSVSTFRDADNRDWELIDFRLEHGKKKRVRLGAPNADGRAFRSGGDVRVYYFAQPFDYRATTESVLRAQFESAQPPDSAAVPQPFQSPRSSSSVALSADKSNVFARGEILSFFIARSTGALVDIDNLKFRARDRGVERWRVETSYRVRGRPSEVHVVCHWRVAEQLRDEIRSAKAADDRARDACARDVATIDGELAERLAPPRSYIPKDGMTGHD